MARGTAGAPGPRGRVLDGPDRGDQRAVPRLRRGDRLRHHGREAAGARGDHEPGPARHAPAASGDARPRLAGLHPARGPGRPARLLAVVDLGPRRRLAASRGARQLPRRPRRSPGRPGLVGRRRRLRPMGRQAAADRGRVGVRRPRRTRRQALHLGRRTAVGHRQARQHLAGRVPAIEHRRRRLRQDVSRPVVPAQRLRPVRHGRQRLGVVRRLVSIATSIASGPDRASS